MIAYRLHYEPYNQTVIEMCRQKALGRVKTFAVEQLPGRRRPRTSA